MIRLSKRLLYTIEAVLDVACHEGEGPVRMVDMAAREDIPRRYLEPVLQQLVRENILTGIRGPAGGYRLARLPEAISLGDIVRIVRSLETAEDPLDTGGGVLGREIVRPLWAELDTEMMRRLTATTIKTLRDQARRQARRAQRAAVGIRGYES